jgi:polyisoprenoid-binding protein YceI
MHRAACIIGGAAALLLSPLAGVVAFDAARSSFVANDPIGRNVVMIESRAPLETILTRTNQVTGELSLNPENVLDEPRARFQVDLGSLDTGITLRNEHLRGPEWLDTARFPKAVFSLTRILTPREPTPLRAGEVVPLEVEGTLSLHGVERQIRMKAETRYLKRDAHTAQRLPGHLLHLRVQFPLRLADYDIKIPGMVGRRVAGEQQVTVDIYTSTALLDRVR